MFLIEHFILVNSIKYHLVFLEETICPTFTLPNHFDHDTGKMGKWLFL